MMARTDSARIPSSPGCGPHVGPSPRALASVLMLRQVPPADVAALPSHAAETSVGRLPSPPVSGRPARMTSAC